MKLFKYFLSCCVFLFVAGAAPLATDVIGQETVQQERKTVRLGTFDSRAIAVAYVRSESFQQKIDLLQKQLKQAKEDGDEQQVKKLETLGPEMQAQLHKQAFGTAAVDQILELVKDKIPGIAANSGVEVIVSKWDIVYQKSDDRFVDVTADMVKLFEPDEKTLKVIEQLRSKPPVPNKDIK